MLSVVKEKGDTKNIIALPPFYRGTSFEDIVRSLQKVVKETGFPIQFVGTSQPFLNRLRNEFLDDEQYFSGQLRLLKQLLTYRKVQKILFLDFFNPGLDLLRYSHEQQNIHCKYGSLLHGGTFMDDDVYAWKWLQLFEMSWASLYEHIYSPSKFLSEKPPLAYKHKIKNFVWGMDHIQNQSLQRKKDIDVIFPHRLSQDKGVRDLLYIIERAPKIQFGIAVPQNKKNVKREKIYTKLLRSRNVSFFYGENSSRHLQTLSRAKIVLSCAKQETFGYGVMKAVVMNCIPLLPKRLSYPEFFPQKYLYNNLADAISRINVLTKKRGQSIQDLQNLREKISNFSFTPLLIDFFSKRK